MQSRVCLTAPIFTSARACGHQALARTPSQGTTHHTDDLAGSLGLSCVRGASLEETSVKIHRSQPACRQHQRPRCSLRIIGMLWTGRSCRRRQCWLWRKRKRATGPASAPKLRQNRFKYRATFETELETGKNRGLVWIASSSSSVSMEGCQRKSIWRERSTPRSASPPSQPPVFPGLQNEPDGQDDRHRPSFLFDRSGK